MTNVGRLLENLRNSEDLISEAKTDIVLQHRKQAKCFFDFAARVSKLLVLRGDVDSTAEMKIIHAAVKHLNDCLSSMDILLTGSTDEDLFNALGYRNSNFTALNDGIMSDLTEDEKSLAVVNNCVTEICNTGQLIGIVNALEWYLDVLVSYARSACTVFKFFQAHLLDDQHFSSVSYHLGLALAELEKLTPRADGKTPRTREAASTSNQT